MTHIAPRFWGRACLLVFSFGSAILLGCSSVQRNEPVVEVRRLTVAGHRGGVDYISWSALFDPQPNDGAWWRPRNPKVRSFVKERFEIQDERGRLYEVDRARFSRGKIGYGVSVYLDSRKIPDDVKELRTKISFVVNGIRFKLEDRIFKGPKGNWCSQGGGKIAVRDDRMPEKSSSRVPGLQW